MAEFHQVGTIEKVYNALRVSLTDGYPLGELVIGSENTTRLLDGSEVDVNFVQRRPGHDAFIGYAGTARISRSGRAVNIWIEGRLMTAPLAQVRQVAAGERASARLSSPDPIIDADEEQRKAIDHDLVRSFI